MIAYFLLCIISILTGRGLLTILRAPTSPSLSIYLAPVITLSFWTLFLGWGVCFHYPVKNLWLLGWILTAGFSVIGIYNFSRHHKIFLTSHSIVIVFIILLPILTMAPYFYNDLLNYGGADAPDGWSYIALGQYLWENIRGADGQLIPLHQYAAHLAHTRFVASALLGFFSPLVHSLGDTQLTANLLLAWSLFNLASACAFFAATQKIGKYIVFYLVLVIFSGWILKLLTANNFDNAIILSFLPAYAGIATLLQEHKSKWVIVLAILSAAVFYCYIELAPIILFGALILCIKNKKSIFIFIFTIAALTLLLSLPYLKEGLFYFLSQLHLGLQISNRPGEGMFSSLLNYHNLITAFWGLKPPVFSKILGLTISILTVLGFVVLWKKKEFNLIFLALLILTATGNMLFFQHYSYGAYKFILLNSWLLTFMLVTAIKSILANKKYPILFATILTLFGISYISTSYLQLRDNAEKVSIKDIRPFRELSQIDRISDHKAILVAVDNMLANEWAVYFLREHSIKLKFYRSYMNQAHVIPYMERAKKPNPNNIEFILTDNPALFPKLNLLWSSGPYYLFNIKNVKPSER